MHVSNNRKEPEDMAQASRLSDVRAYQGYLQELSSFFSVKILLDVAGTPGCIMYMCMCVALDLFLSVQFINIIYFYYYAWLLFSCIGYGL